MGVYRGYIGKMEKKMETTIMGWTITVCTMIMIMIVTIVISTAISTDTSSAAIP